MQALQASLLASLKVSTQETLDAQLSQALAAGCTNSLEPCVQGITALIRMQSALLERVAQMDITPQRNQWSSWPRSRRMRQSMHQLQRDRRA